MIGGSHEADIEYEKYQTDKLHMSVMDGVRIPIERTAALIKWNMVGEVLVPGVLEAGTIEKTDGCAQAAALAEKL